MEDCEKAALKYLDMGFSVLPLGLDKRPMLYEWRSYQKRHPMPAQIHEWWGQWPDAGVGIITGKISGIAVVDLDSDSAVRHYQTLGVLPTPTVVTKKGYHVYFFYPYDKDVVVRNQVNSDLGIDVRGEGGYVVAPPSIHPDGVRYTWTNRHLWNTTMQELPEDFIKRKVEYQGNETDEQHWAVEALQGISEGGRNNLCAQLAGRFILKGLGCREVYELLSMWNERNNPPMPEREVETTVRSIFQSHRSKP